jgi:hypothetical protein
VTDALGLRFPEQISSESEIPNKHSKIDILADKRRGVLLASMGLTKKY